jgi:hypothetical protein
MFYPQITQTEQLFTQFKIILIADEEALLTEKMMYSRVSEAKKLSLSDHFVFDQVPDKHQTDHERRGSCNH